MHPFPELIVLVILLTRQYHCVKVIGQLSNLGILLDSMGY